MARRKTVDILDAIDPRNYLPYGEDELEEDQSPINAESLRVYTFLFRIMEQWKFLPVEYRDGGVIKGAYLGEVDDSWEAAQNVINLLERHFGKGRKIDKDSSFSRYESQKED